MKAPRPLDHSCLACQVRTGTICAPLTDAQLTEVETIRHHDRIVPRGTHLFHAGEQCPSFYTVKSGWVMLYGLLVDGRRQIHGFGLPGAFLGHHPEDGTPVQYSAQALTEVEVCARADRAVVPPHAGTRGFVRLRGLARARRRGPPPHQHRATQCP
jgi:CRP-like cAMP-binding protein